MPILTRPRFIGLSAIIFLFASGSVAMAQHDPGGITGGGMIGGSTGRPSTKPATKPASKPAATTTTPRRRHHSRDYSNQTREHDDKANNIDDHECRRLLSTRRSSLQRTKVSRSTRTISKGHADQSVDVVSALSHRLDL